MLEKSITMHLPEGDFETTVLAYSDSDKKRLADFYNKWRDLCNDCSELRSRTINIPDGLSEGAFCWNMGTVRLISNFAGANTSFDAYDEARRKRIQIKACSVIPDLTSFGPRSVWDELYFLDFYRKGKWDGTFDIYLISNKYIHNHSVNSNQTFREQQAERRRPRFSIYTSIITAKKLKPIKTVSLFN